MISLLLSCSKCFGRFVEKGNLEVQLFILTSKLRANHQKMYNPPETKALNDINKVCPKSVLGVTKRPPLLASKCSWIFLDNTTALCKLLQLLVYCSGYFCQIYRGIGFFFKLILKPVDNQSSLIRYIYLAKTS